MAMKPFILLLRGINVGGKNILPMKDLRAFLLELGCQNIRTYIQSGNVALRAVPIDSDKIEEAIASKFGFRPHALVLTEDQFLTAILNNPFKQLEPKSVHFYFCKNPPESNDSKLQEYVAQSERYALIDGVFYLYAPEGIGRSKLMCNLEKCLGVPATGRNLTTIQKLSDMLRE